MGVLIIDPEGNVTGNEVPECELPKDREEIPSGGPMPGLEEVVSDSDLIRTKIEKEQFIISQLIGFNRL